MSDNIIRPQQFDRPAVHQPHPRLRRGTIAFRAWVRRKETIAWNERQSKDVRRMADRTKRSERFLQRCADLREAEIAPLHIPNEGMEAYAVVRTLMNVGLGMTYDTKRNALVLYAQEPLIPPTAS